MRKVDLREVVYCSDEHQEQLRAIRNQTDVRRAMYTEHLIGIPEHRSWINRLKSDEGQRVFAVIIDGRVRGMVSLTAIDKLHRKADWAFYIDGEMRGGLGVALEFSLLNFAFDIVGLEKLNCEVLETNIAVVERHKSFGFNEEGFRRQNVIKNNERIGVFFLGITQEEWRSERNNIYSTFQRVIDRFEINIVN